MSQKGNANNYVVDSINGELDLNTLVQYAIDYAHCIGLVCRTEKHKFESDVAETAPITLLPSPFPQQLYDLAISVQKSLNELYFRISMDHDFLLEAYKDVVKTDEFMRRSMEIMEKVRAEGLHQKIVLSVQRADYLTHMDSKHGKIELKQVEVNVGQIGGPGHASCMSKVHKQVLGKVEALKGANEPKIRAGTAPQNSPKDGMANVLYEAWKRFGDPKAVVLFLNQSDLFPVCHFEQAKFVLFQLENLAKADGHHLNVMRLSIVECSDRLHLDEKDFSLYIDKTLRVSVVHMAYGYMLEHFPSEREWEMRLQMERSTAILSPNIYVQLAGAKKIQQMLAQPGMLERFMPEAKEQIALLRKTYTGLWGLDSNNESTLAAVKEAMRSPGHFVLKSQLEAGKGNFFDEEIPEMLSTLSTEEKAAYILMQKINPVVVKNYMVRPFQKPQLEDIVSELSIYGSLLGDRSTGKVLWNTVDGHLVRSKPASANQGGVTAGSGVIDSVILFPDNKFS